MRCKADILVERGIPVTMDVAMKPRGELEPTFVKHGGQAEKGAHSGHSRDGLSHVTSVSDPCFRTEMWIASGKFG
jgi:hypothetical protein